jgi:U3 small nucleolar RNA-associated protein 15
MSMFHELVQRSALVNALSGRDEESLRPILVFLIHNIVDCRYSSLLIDVCSVVLGTTASACHPVSLS